MFAEHLRSPVFAALARNTASAFTRVRKLPLFQLVTFLINLPRSGLQAELFAYFDHALGLSPDHAISKSALCQARRQLNPESMRHLLQFSHQCIVQHVPAPSWHGFQIKAIDSSVLRLPSTPECIEHFGGMHPHQGSFSPLCRASVLYDVARGCCVDAVLGSYHQGDRELALNHRAYLDSTDLVVYDRGYPSREFFIMHLQQSLKFCMRISMGTWNQVKAFAQGSSNDTLINLGTASEPLSLRLLRARLPNGQVYYFATNLLDPCLNAQDFADLYRGRWRIEEAFKLIKARMNLENWTGILPYVVQQDFYASLLHANFASMLAVAAAPYAMQPLGGAHICIQGWIVKLNQTLVIKILRHHLPKLLLGCAADNLTSQLIQRLQNSSCLERQREIRGSQPRRTRSPRTYFSSYKAA